MRYKEYYYKNLCEQLQDRINILEKFLSEAGLKRAMKSGNPEQLKKEYIRQRERKKVKQRGLGKTDQESAAQLDKNVEEIGMQLSTDYPQEYRQAKEMSPYIGFPPPSEMAANFFAQGRRTSGSYQY